MSGIRVPSLADEVVRVRRWRETDIPAQLEAFADPWFLRFSDWAPQTETAARAYLAEHERARERESRLNSRWSRQTTTTRCSAAPR